MLEKMDTSPSTSSAAEQEASKEYILSNPEKYIGSLEQVMELMWVFDQEMSALTRRKISYVPGLYKIFDEVLVNAVDNKARDPAMNKIKVDIDGENNVISIYNNGRGIPVVQSKDNNGAGIPVVQSQDNNGEGIPVETQDKEAYIFRHLLTSSNYNHEEEEEVARCRNEIGDKLCNIFSTKFVLETASAESGKSVTQTWWNNMGETGNLANKDCELPDFTRVTFSPDLVKFKMDSLDRDTVALLSRRAFDVAACTRGVNVLLNGKPLPVKTFKDYVELFLKGRQDDEVGQLKPIFETVNDHWEIAVAHSDTGFQQVSFVNSVATTKGGCHVDFVTDMICQHLQDFAQKNKGSGAIEPHQVKDHIWVFINCLIVNPTFDFDKLKLTSPVESFGYNCSLSEKFLMDLKNAGIMESVEAKLKAQNLKKRVKLEGIPELEDANDAGTHNSINCTLIVTEDSMKSLAVSGLEVVGRNRYGVFPLKGKLLNAHEFSHEDILEESGIKYLVNILGLQFHKKYESRDDIKTLRYGELLVFTNHDLNGWVIKALLIEYFQRNWPSLLKYGLIAFFKSPVVKALKGTNLKEDKTFFSLHEYEDWKKNNDDWPSFNFRSLAAFTNKDVKMCFEELKKNRIRVLYAADELQNALDMCFSREPGHVLHREEWLNARLKDHQQPMLYREGTIYCHEVVSQLIVMLDSDNRRLYPSLVDGLKPGQRKVLFTCLKRHYKREVNVAQLAASVVEHSGYHHGEASLKSTIVGLAQDFVGSNNISLLLPRGQFGTRFQGGKDAASPRYLFTLINKLTRVIFDPHDDPLLKYLHDENQRIEPEWYAPIIPMILVNGGYDFGLMTNIPSYNPRDIVEKILRMLQRYDEKGLEGLERLDLSMTPWFNGFMGTIETTNDPHRYAISGKVAVLRRNEVEITELPIRVWTQEYREAVMEVLLHGSEEAPALISGYKEYHTDTAVRFVVNGIDDKMDKAKSEELHRLFELQSTMTTTSMVLFDANGCLKRYDSTGEILREFFDVRLQFYEKRKNYLVGILEAETTKLRHQIRFIFEICNNILTPEDQKSEDLINMLRRGLYESDPVKMWMLAQDKEAILEKVAEQDHDREERKTQVETLKKVDYSYLLDMPRHSLTSERHDELVKLRDAKVIELKVLRQKLPSQLWREDLKNFLEVLRTEETQKRTTETKKTRRSRSPDIEVDNESPSDELGGAFKEKFNYNLQAVKKDKKALRSEVDPELGDKVETVNKHDTEARKELIQCPEKDKVDQEKSVLETLGLTLRKDVQRIEKCVVHRPRRASFKNALDALTKNNKRQEKKSGHSEAEERECSADICRKATGKTINWIQCDGKCNLWYHHQCVGLRVKDVKKDEKYYCKRCSAKDHSTSTANDDKDLQADV